VCGQVRKTVPSVSPIPPRGKERTLRYRYLLFICKRYIKIRSLNTRRATLSFLKADCGLNWIATSTISRSMTNLNGGWMIASGFNKVMKPFDYQEALQKIPHKPGVYQYWDTEG